MIVRLPLCSPNSSTGLDATFLPARELAVFLKNRSSLDYPASRFSTHLKRKQKRLSLRERQLDALCVYFDPPWLARNGLYEVAYVTSASVLLL